MKLDNNILETPLTNSILALLRMSGWFAFKVDSKGTYDSAKRVFRSNPSRVKGVSDVIAIKDGRVIFLEVKTPQNNSGKKKNGQSDDQIEFELNIHNQGGEYYVVKSIDDTLKIIRRS